MALQLAGAFGLDHRDDGFDLHIAVGALDRYVAHGLFYGMTLAVGQFSALFPQGGEDRLHGDGGELVGKPVHTGFHDGDDAIHGDGVGEGGDIPAHLLLLPVEPVSLVFDGLDDHIRGQGLVESGDVPAESILFSGEFFGLSLEGVDDAVRGEGAVEFFHRPVQGPSYDRLLALQLAFALRLDRSQEGIDGNFAVAAANGDIAQSLLQGAALALRQLVALIL